MLLLLDFLLSLLTPFLFLFEELGRYAKGVGQRSLLIVGLVRSQLSMFFSNVHHTIPRDCFRDYLKEVLEIICQFGISGTNSLDT